MRWMNKLSWAVWVLIALYLGWFVVAKAQVQQAGDIAEYYGMTESIKNHGGVVLKGKDQEALEQVLHPVYFKDPQYYMAGKNGDRYPVHFMAYSIMALPLRVMLEWLSVDPRRSLFIANWLSIILAVGYIFWRYLKQPFYRLALLAFTFSGALMSFLVWPGPDLWYLSLLLVVPFAFFGRAYWLAVVLVALASWHSQPLVIFAIGLAGYACYRSLRVKQGESLYLKLTWQPWVKLLGVGLLMSLPYLYNLSVFGVLNLWSILPEEWTKLYGFGLRNISLWKFYEQWFDLNIGLFWYVPLLFVLAVIGVWRLRKYDGRLVFFVLLALLTAFFYQTNPAWHYGTVGYGPGRHSVYLLPLLIFFAVRAMKPRLGGVILVLMVVISQFGILSLNRGLEPDFTKTLDQSPLAKFVLSRLPQVYNPTPEIFVDRTNHADIHYPTSALYRLDSRCIKAYVLMSEKQWLLDQCGFIPAEYESQFDDPLSRFTNVSREVVTKEATYWPESVSCADGYQPTPERPFSCLKTMAEFATGVGLADTTRVATVAGFPYPGIWKVTWGEPVRLTVPPGYLVDHYAINGIYVNYPTN